MKPTVYLETSIISYLTAKPSRDLVVAWHQQITIEWWEQIRPIVECYISLFVIQESSRADEEFAQKRLACVSNMPILEVNEDIEGLARKYFNVINLPEKAKIDSVHLPVAAWHKIDYVLSWNCKHIVSGRVRKMWQEVNMQLGIHTPVLCTPEELMEV